MTRIDIREFLDESAAVALPGRTYHTPANPEHAGDPACTLNDADRREPGKPATVPRRRVSVLLWLLARVQLGPAGAEDQGRKPPSTR